MAKRTQVLGALAGFGTATSQFGRQIQEAKSIQQQMEEREAEAERQAKLFPSQLLTADATAQTAQIGAQKGQIGLDETRGQIDARTQFEIASDAANQLAVQPDADPEKLAREKKAELAAMARYLGRSGKPTTVEELEKRIAGEGAGTPSSIQEWNTYNAMTPEQQAEYLKMKRAQKTLDLGGSQVLLAPSGEVAKTFVKTLKPGETPEVKGAQAAAVAAGTESVTGKADIDRQRLELDKEKAAREKKEAAQKHQQFVAAKTSEMEKLQEFAAMVEKTKANKALAGVTGWGSAGRFVPGSPWADVNADVERIADSGVIEVMAQLKRESPTGSTGFGALSQNELKILENAFSSLKNRDISPAKMREELGRISSTMNKYLERIQNFQTGETAAPAGGPEVGTVEDGYRFKGGDPKDPANWEPVQ